MLQARAQADAAAIDATELVRLRTENYKIRAELQEQSQMLGSSGKKRDEQVVRLQQEKRALGQQLDSLMADVGRPQVRASAVAAPAVDL